LGLEEKKKEKKNSRKQLPKYLFMEYNQLISEGKKKIEGLNQY
jgi:hypothetical protein